MFSICVFDGFGLFLVLVTWERWDDLLLLLVIVGVQETEGVFVFHIFTISVRVSLVFCRIWYPCTEDGIFQSFHPIIRPVW